MKKQFIVVLVAIILLLNFGQFKAESSPESDAIVIISDRMSNTLLELSTASTNFEVKKIPGLIYLLETDLVRLDRAYKNLSSQEKAILRKPYQNARAKLLVALKNGHDLMKLLGQE